MCFRDVGSNKCTFFGVSVFGNLDFRCHVVQNIKIEANSASGIRTLNGVLPKCVYKMNGLGEINLLKTKRRLLYLKAQSLPRCKHFSSRL
jgi:hypothetical protein